MAKHLSLGHRGRGGTHLPAVGVPKAGRETGQWLWVRQRHLSPPGWPQCLQLFLTRDPERLMGRENFFRANVWYAKQCNLCCWAFPVFRPDEAFVAFLNGSRGARADDACRCEPVHPKKIDNESWFF